MLYLILGILLLVIIVLIIAFVQKRKGIDPSEVVENPAIDCCGAHEVCEADSLLNKDLNIIYYDDENLDKYSGYDPKSYTNEEIDEFQEVLITMQEAEVAAWIRSLNLRGIELPSVVKEEALFIVDEVRQIRMQSALEKKSQENK